MRFDFSSTSRPKKAAKHIARCLDLTLSMVQDAVAKTCGYRDWHDLEREARGTGRLSLDESLPDTAFISRQVDLSLALADHLSIPHGDAQYALARARLTGNRPPDLQTQVAIRLACFRARTLPAVGRYEPGEVGLIDLGGRGREPAILVKYGQATRAVTRGGEALVADFEYTSTGRLMPLFLPRQLYYPYKAVEQMDGTTVLLSREYQPLWEIGEDGSINRLPPWSTRSSFGKKVRNIWDEAPYPWGTEEVERYMIGVLESYGVRELPILADLLPLAIQEPEATETGLLRQDLILRLRKSREATAIFPPRTPIADIKDILPEAVRASPGAGVQRRSPR